MSQDSAATCLLWVELVPRALANGLECWGLAVCSPRCPKHGKIRLVLGQAMHEFLSCEVHSFPILILALNVPQPKLQLTVVDMLEYVIAEVPAVASSEEEVEEDSEDDNSAEGENRHLDLVCST